jgi:hypothetical protein
MGVFLVLYPDTKIPLILLEPKSIVCFGSFVLVPFGPSALAFELF